MRSTLALFAALLAAVAFTGAAPAAAAEARTPPWLLTSDVHFDPFAGATGALVGRMEKAPVRRWRKLLASTGPAPARYGEDTPASLLESSLRAMRRAAPSPPVVLIAGDLLAHEFRQTYEKLAPRPSTGGYRSFVDKTIAYLARRFGATFPRAQFVVTLGNNDSYCGDYAANPDSRFMVRTARAWQPLVDRHGRAPGFLRSFRKLGSYVARLPGSHLRAVAVDDVFWSSGYEDKCGQSADPGSELAGWLAAVVRRLPRGDRALALTHIPPGIDVYATLGGSGAPVPLLTGPGQSALLRALYSKSVATLVFGHLHMNTYRIGRKAPMLGVPAISPQFGNDPSFLTATVGRDGTIDDYVAYALDLRHRRRGWRREYRFSRLYGLRAFDVPSLRRLHRKLGHNRKLRRDYRRFYDSGGLYPISEAEYPAYACGSGFLGVRAFSACVRSAEDGKR